MSTSLAKAISFLFHPLLMPSYGLLLLLYSDNYYSFFLLPRLQLLLIIITLVFTFLLPALNAFILFKTGYLSTLQMDKKEERRLPYLVTVIFYFAEFYILSDSPIPHIIKILILGAILSVLLTFIINMRWKISAHMIGIGGVTGAFLIMAMSLNLFYEIILLFFLSGLVGFARIKLEKHSPAQVYAGYLLGFFCNAGLLYIVLQQ